MGDVKASNDLEIDRAENADGWKVIGKWVAWAGLSTIVLFAALGFTGRGGIFGRVEIADESVALNYPVVLRREAADDLTLSITTYGEDNIDIVLDEALAEMLQLDQILPRPANMIAIEDGLRLLFAPARSRLDLVLRLRPTHAAWFRNYKVTVRGGQLEFNMVVLP